AGLMQVADVKHGDVLVRQGESIGDLYVLIEGKLCARSVDSRGTRRIEHDLGPGGAFGEMAILADDVASATVQAVAPALIARLPRDSFERFSARSPTAALQLTQALSQRVREHRLMAAVHLTDIFRGLDQAFLDD